MIEDIANVLTWALCGGILVAIVLVWIYAFAGIVLDWIRRYGS